MTATIQSRTSILTSLTKSKSKSNPKSATSTRKKETRTSIYFKPPTKSPTTTKKPNPPIATTTTPTTTTTPPTQPLPHTLHLISSHPTLTPYRRKIYRTLLSIPRGRWTTYSALATHLSSSARAVGNAMRTNPFAPHVPCHRVLAADRTVGGYKGSWGNGGDYATEKMGLLRGEGVVFDGRGRVGGLCFGGFWEVGVEGEGEGKRGEGD
ncbi:hypothetical protein FQN50_007355 [Emmonsiellopsis sp. PD_5]|nr:hypothetical protein FQN50_007355 [Emmonsiellopsis sp. PD_5]